MEEKLESEDDDEDDRSDKEWSQILIAPHIYQKLSKKKQYTMKVSWGWIRPIIIYIHNFRMNKNISLSDAKIKLSSPDIINNKLPSLTARNRSVSNLLNG